MTGHFQIRCVKLRWQKFEKEKKSENLQDFDGLIIKVA